jgi:limonene-1,2-epoxide hydrolase
MTDPDPTTVVARLWDAVYARDWERIASHLGEEAIYYDVPTGPSTAAVGPQAIVGRLRLGLEPLARYEHREGRVASTGDVVMVEHAETWGWHTGEECTLPFVTVHRVVADEVVLWKDYWSYDHLLDHAPGWWKDRLFTADLWWLTDVTGSDAL